MICILYVYEYTFVKMLKKEKLRKKLKNLLQKLEPLEQEVFISFSSEPYLKQVLGIVDSVFDWQYTGYTVHGTR